MKKTPRLSVLCCALTLVALIADGSAHAAANFQFSAIYLPDTIPAGGAAVAYIKVTNTTQGALSNYVVRCLSSTVQVDPINVFSPYCSNPIYLPVGQSCILQLDISGPVQTSFDLCNGIACTTSGINLNVQEKPNVAGIAAGGYSVLGGGPSLLLAFSLGGSNPWSYVIDSSSLPNSASFYAASCSLNKCLAVGGADNAPVFAYSTDAGSSWAYNTSLPSDYQCCGNFRAGTFQGTNAVAAGSYVNSSNIFLPLLGISSNSGTSLMYVDPPSGVTGFSEYLATTCTSAFCLAAGYYTTMQGRFLLVAKGTTSSTTWAFPISDGFFQPSDLSSLGGFINSFRGIDCSDVVCAAAGQYSTNTFPNVFYPVVAENSDGLGLNWTYPINATTNLPSDFNTTEPFGYFQSTSCSGQVCGAVGGYDNINNQFVPLLAVRTSSVSGWNYPIITPLLPSGTVSGLFSSVSCSTSTCVAAGYTGNSSGQTLPIVLYSLNGGVSWNFPPTIAHFPSDFSDSGAFNWVNCVGLSCLAGGSYSSSTGISYPLLAQSSDGGVTWNYAINSVTPALPSDFDGGQFNATAVTTSSWLPESLKLLHAPRPIKP